MKIIVYRARDGWRWHMKASNGKIVADSNHFVRVSTHDLRRSK